MRRALRRHAGIPERHLPLLHHHRLSLHPAVPEGDRGGAADGKSRAGRRPTATSAAVAVPESRPQMNARSLVRVAFLLVAAPALASAHLMPAWQGSTHVVGNRAYTLLSVPIGALTGFDDDHDGRISREELGAHNPELIRQLDRLVTLRSVGVVGRTLFESLAMEHASEVADTGMTSVTLMRISEWDSTVTGVSVTADVFPPGSKEQIMFRAITGDSIKGDLRIE